MTNEAIWERPVPATAPLFEPLTIAGLTLSNRIAVAPMTRVSASDAGCATARMAQYYGAFAQGGFGLLITEGIYTDAAWSQGYRFQPGLAEDRQRDAWRRVVDRVHAAGGRIIAQLMHAGALSQYNRSRSDTRGPSAVRPKGQQMTFYRGSGDYRAPVAMTGSEIAEAVAGFAAAALRAREAGFDGVEVHGANGYLLDQFLSEGINLRGDRYGDGVAGRLLLTVEVVQSVRTAIGPDFLVGLRSSQGKVNDFAHKWRGPEEAAAIYERLGRLPLDYLHITEFEAWQPAFAEGPSLAALAKRHGRLPVIANGSLHDPEQAAGMLSRGEADAVSLGRGALTHADWPRRVERNLSIEQFDGEILAPTADLANADRLRTR
ncbi:2,4-dienoyl-CoA reductase-like NADH-dependent reductase (Old Yellow Enzyme family) [Sphingomonas sp. UYAg733]